MNETWFHMYRISFGIKAVTLLRVLYRKKYENWQNLNVSTEM